MPKYTHIDTAKRSEKKKQLERLVNKHYGGKKSLFAQGIYRSWNCVHGWMTGSANIPAYVWDHFDLLETRE